jgi:two-component system chemotaxis response regulator CheB
VADRRPLSVLVVDDSAVVRQAMLAILSAEQDLLVSVAADPYFALEKMERVRPDVILLDLEMPRMDGLTFLRRIMTHDPIPVVVCAGGAGRGTETAIRALEEGAVEVLSKPALGLRDFLHEQAAEFVTVIRSAAEARLTARRRTSPLLGFGQGGTPAHRRPVAGAAEGFIAMGASTGGPEARRTILEGFSEDAPATLIVQHMPPAFTPAFARRLDGLCRMRVRELRGPELLMAGTAWIAPGDRHLVVRATPAGLVADLQLGERVSGHRPSVDLLFRSLAEAAPERVVAALLTGMGADGAEGLAELRQSGATTIAQDEATSVVWGMPKAAIDRDAADEILPLERIGSTLLMRARRVEATLPVRGERR